MGHCKTVEVGIWPGSFTDWQLSPEKQKRAPQAICALLKNNPNLCRGRKGAGECCAIPSHWDVIALLRAHLKLQSPALDWAIPGNWWMQPRKETRGDKRSHSWVSCHRVQRPRFLQGNTYSGFSRSHSFPVLEVKPSVIMGLNCLYVCNVMQCGS